VKSSKKFYNFIIILQCFAALIMADLVIDLVIRYCSMFIFNLFIYYLLLSSHIPMCNRLCFYLSFYLLTVPMICFMRYHLNSSFLL